MLKFSGCKPVSHIKKHTNSSLFETFQVLSESLGALSFGQGFFSSPIPDFLKNSVKTVFEEDSSNSYGRILGIPELANTISGNYSKVFNRQLNPKTEVVVTHGATQAIFSCFAAYLEPGNEVVCFGPFFTWYLPQVEVNGGVLKTINIKEPKNENADWEFNFEEFEATLNEKTKFVIINNPLNPCGKVFSRSDLEKLAEVIKKYPNICVIADEVYEHTTRLDIEYIRFANIPDMWERTISVYSGGKLLNCTGWRIGWAIGPDYLIKYMGTYLCWSTAGPNRPSSKAVHYGLIEANKEYKRFDSYYLYLQNEFDIRIKTFYEILCKHDLGWKHYKASGGYFTVSNIRNAIHHVPIKYFYKDLEKVANGDQKLKNLDEW